MADVEQPLVGKAHTPTWNMTGFGSVVGAITTLLVVAFCLFTKYTEDDDDQLMYMYYIHVAIMIFVGFGFLMTFLKRYSWGAVSLNFMTSCVMMLTHILVVSCPVANGRHHTFLSRLCASNTHMWCACAVFVRRLAALRPLGLSVQHDTVCPACIKGRLAAYRIRHECQLPICKAYGACIVQTKHSTDEFLTLVIPWGFECISRQRVHR